MVIFEELAFTKYTPYNEEIVVLEVTLTIVVLSHILIANKKRNTMLL
jgi:hypothetical protein